MAERASMPTFVPRTVASFERAATVMARRLAAPARMLAARALTFADRVVGSWTGAGPAARGFDNDLQPAMRAATRGGAMLLPRPWYEGAADEGVPGRQNPPTAMPPASAAAASRTMTRGLSSAERGTAIVRTPLTAADAPAAPAATVSSSTEVAIDGTGVDAQTSAMAAIAEPRVAELLGLHRPAAAAQPIVAPRAERAATLLGRALAHTAWIDAQLRVTAPVEAATAALFPAGYVLVTPADVERPPAARAAATVGAESRFGAPHEAATANLAAWLPSLPDPRLAATAPTPIAQRVADFVARLVGVTTAGDVAPLPSSTLGAAAPAASAAAERTYVATAALAPTRRPEPASTGTALASSGAAASWRPTVAASWRPGAAAARIEQLGASVDARATAAWGEEPAARRTPAAHNPPRVTSNAGAAARRALPSVPRDYVTPGAPVSPGATGPARLSQFMDQLVGVQAARATAPLPVQALVTALERAPLATLVTAAPGSAAASASGRSLGPPATPASSSAPSTPAAAAAAAYLSTGAAAPAMTGTAMAPGAIGRRAEQLGSVVGVRAASLSIDFVDPARLSTLTSAAPAMPTVTSAVATSAREAIVSPRRPGPAEAAPALTSEEWSLVATFPSAATAMQLVAARQSAHWSAAAAPSRVLPSGVVMGPLLSPSGGRSELPEAAIAGRQTLGRAVTSTSAALGSRGRLPGGRLPRGSFTWPQLLASAPAHAEWTPSSTVTAAEHTKLAAPGTPLWGAMPPLLSPPHASLSPSHAASGRSVAGATASSPATTIAAKAALGAPRSDGPPPSLQAAWGRELVRGDAGAGSAGGDAGAGGAGGAASAGGAGGIASAGGAGSDASAGGAGGIASAGGAGGIASAGGAGGAATAMDRHAAAATSRSDAPAMTLMVAAATREARAAARIGRRADSVADGDGAGAGSDLDPAPALPSVGTAPARPGGLGVSNVRPLAAMPFMTAPGGVMATGGAAGPAARALDLARPFLRLVDNGLGSDGGQRTGAPRFYEQPQPLVSGAPSSDSASRLVEALRSQPAASSGDDRVSLADLTLIAIASATQQVAASAAGGGPSGAAAAAPATAAAPESAAGGPAGGRSGNPAQEIEELARAAFDELQRLMAMARERSGDHG